MTVLVRSTKCRSVQADRRRPTDGLVRRAHRQPCARRRTGQEGGRIFLGVGPTTASAVVVSVSDSRTVCQRPAVRRLAGPGAEPELKRRQGQPAAHHQAGRRLPANLANPSRDVRGVERWQAKRPHQPVAGAAQGAAGLAVGSAGAAQ